VIRGSPAAFIFARIWIRVAAGCEVRGASASREVRGARCEVRANIFARVWILVPAGCKERARVVRCEVRAQGKSWEVRAGRCKVWAALNCEVRAPVCELW
jgi:hypothetical protein